MIIKKDNDNYFSKRPDMLESKIIGIINRYFYTPIDRNDPVVKNMISEITDTIQKRINIYINSSIENTIEKIIIKAGKSLKYNLKSERYLYKAAIASNDKKYYITYGNYTMNFDNNILNVDSYIDKNTGYNVLEITNNSANDISIALTAQEVIKNEWYFFNKKKWNY